MIEQFVALYPKGRITYQQTSFLELTTDIEVHRITFVGKAQARIKRGTYGELAYFTKHPALLNYNYPISLITVRVSETLPDGFLEDYETCLAKWRGGWHHFPSWSGLSFFSQYELAVINSHHPYRWLNFPDFIAEDVILLCQQYGLQVTRTAPSRHLLRLLSPTEKFSMLCIGSSYAIARDFYVSTLR